jgi:hypothetical protein
MHTNTSSMKSFSKTYYTSSCYACSYFVFLVSLSARLQLQDLFLMPWDWILTSLILVLPWWSFNHGPNIQCSWFHYASAPTLYVLCVHAITVVQIISHLMLFITFVNTCISLISITHINHYWIHMFSIIT